MDYYSEKLDKLQLQAAYENTDYQILNPSISIICNAKNPSIDNYLQQLRKKSWCLITAFNPLSKIQPKQINGWNNANLEFDLSFKGYSYTYAKGIGKDMDWPPEDSFLVLDICIADARLLAKKYQQHAILFGCKGEEAYLEWIDY